MPTVTVRFGSIRAYTASPKVRFGAITAYAVQATEAWDGTQWVPEVPLAAQVNLGATAAMTITANAALAVDGGVALVSLVGNGALTVTASASLTVHGETNANPIVTVIPDPANWPPRMLVEIDGFDGASVTVTRNDRGSRDYVRNGNPLALSSGAAVLWDNEMRYNSPISYIVTDGRKTVVTPKVSLTVGCPWLVHPAIPDLSRPLTLNLPVSVAKAAIVSIGGRTSDDAASTVHHVLGRSKPIVITDGTRGSTSFGLSLKTMTSQDYDALTALLGDAAPLLLQVVYPDTARAVYEWVSVSGVSETPRTFPFADPSAIWTMTCTVVDPPVSLSQVQRTWADVVAEYPTWEAACAVNDLWRDLVTDNRNDL